MILCHHLPCIVQQHIFYWRDTKAMHFLTVTLLRHTANFTSPYTVKCSEFKCLCYLPTSFYKDIGTYIIAVCFIPFTEDLKWVMNFNFHDTCTEYSIHLSLFSLCQDSILSRARVFVIWYSVVCSKSFAPTYHTHTHARLRFPYLILRRCSCVEAYINYLKEKCPGTSCRET